MLPTTQSCSNSSRLKSNDVKTFDVTFKINKAISACYFSCSLLL